MEDTTSISNLILLFVILLIFLKLYQSTKSHKNLPPSPPSLPILGHLRLLKPPLHRTLHRLSQSYGPIISLRFGSRLVVVVSSSSAAEECFTKNDVVLANRPKFLAGKLIAYNYSTIAVSPYGDHWRNLRRIAAIEIFSSQRLNMFLSARKDEIKRLIKRICSSEGQDYRKVGLRPLFRDLTFNVMMRMIAGKRFYGEDVTNKEEADEFKEIMEKMMVYVGVSNRSDFLPLLRWIEFGRLEKKLKHFGEKIDRFLQALIDERREAKGNSNTMIDHLLATQESEPGNCTDENIKAMILSLIVAGTDTVAITLEWAMSALLNQPNTLLKAKKEIDVQVGEDRLIDESDLSNLPFLKNIVLETLRLYPAAPLLIPHVPSQNCTIGGYNVPRDTLVMINSWALHRDPDLWDSPLSFMPERFENGEDLGFKLLPFGSGRRACPGAGLGHREIGLTLGSLIQCFEWKRVSDVEIDMTEGIAASMSRAHPLEALCKPHRIINKILSLFKFNYNMLV